MNSSGRISKTSKTLFFTLFLTITVGCSHKPSVYWPRNESVFQDIRWTVALEDSASVLRLDKGVWILPQPPFTTKARTILTRHVHLRQKPHRRRLGRVDQEVLREEGSVPKEFYRFGNKGIVLLGTESRDSTRLLTVYKPPLLVLPENLDRLDSTVVFETVPNVWNAITDTFRTESKMRVRWTLESRGLVRIDSVNIPAVLCRMALSQDGTVGFGETNLIVPDAVMVENKVLFVQGVGPVLEWGIRAAPPEPDAMKDPSSIHEPDQMGGKPRLYIEVILHQIMKNQR
ncbi:MAG TPA: hypothetical protein VGB38_02685 [bacterium]